MEVNQTKEMASVTIQRELIVSKDVPHVNNSLEIEAVVESFRAVDISNVGGDTGRGSKGKLGSHRRWTRKALVRKKSQYVGKKSE